MKKSLATTLAIALCSSAWAADATGSDEADLIVVQSGISHRVLDKPPIDKVIKAFLERKTETLSGRVDIHGKLIRSTVDSERKQVEEEYADGSVYTVPMEIRTNVVSSARRRKAREAARQQRQEREKPMMSKRQREAIERMERLRNQVITIEKNANTGKETIK